MEDDWELTSKVVGGGIGGSIDVGAWAAKQAKASLNAWINSPVERAKQLKSAVSSFVEEVVFLPMLQAGGTLAERFSSWEKFKQSSWSVWDTIRGGGAKSYALGGSALNHIVAGLTSWYDGFHDRMIEGGERFIWTSSPWHTDPLLASLEAGGTTLAYGMGYCVGYIGEQVLIGKGVAVIGKVIWRGGLRLAGTLAGRTTFAVGTRMHAIKKTLQAAGVSAELDRVFEQGLREAASLPVALAGRRVAADVIEEGLMLMGNGRLNFGYRQIIDEMDSASLIMKLCQTSGREGQFWHRFAMFFQIMGDKATESASRGFVPFYNNLLKFSGDQLEQDRLGDAITLFKAENSIAGKEAFRKTLDDVAKLPRSISKPLIYVRDLDKIQPTMYRYSNWVPNHINGAPTLDAHPSDGWYISFDKIDDALEAQRKLLLPPGSNAAYRLEFESVIVKDKSYIPYGAQNTDDVLEPLTRDVPVGGTSMGGSTQLLAKDVSIRLKEVWDISTSPPTLVFP